jgi:hypothetical protein
VSGCIGSLSEAFASDAAESYTAGNAQGAAVEAGRRRGIAGAGGVAGLIRNGWFPNKIAAVSGMQSGGDAMKLTLVGAAVVAASGLGMRNQRKSARNSSWRYPSTVSSGVASPIFCNCSRSVVARRWTASFI